MTPLPISSVKQSLSSYWLARTPRERRILAWGAGILALMLAYAMVWHPARQGVTRLESAMPRLRADLSVMHRQSAEIAALRQNASKPGLDAAGAVAAVQAAASKRGIERAIERVDTMGADRVRIVLKAVPFEAWVAWVDLLQRDHQLVIEAARTDSIERPGFAKVEMVLYLPHAR